MEQILLDTNFVSVLFDPRRKNYQAVQNRAQAFSQLDIVFLSAVVLAELRYGMEAAQLVGQDVSHIGQTLTMPPVYARRIVPCDPVPWLGILHASRVREGRHGCFRCAIPSRFSAHLGPIQLVLHFRQVFFDLPSYLDFCHRAANLVKIHCEMQPGQIAIDLGHSRLNGPFV